jgi:hypothetical protein
MVHPTVNGITVPSHRIRTSFTRICPEIHSRTSTILHWSASAALTVLEFLGFDGFSLLLFAEFVSKAISELFAPASRSKYIETFAPVLGQNRFKWGVPGATAHGHYGTGIYGTVLGNCTLCYRTRSDRTRCKPYCGIAHPWYKHNRDNDFGVT